MVDFGTTNLPTPTLFFRYGFGTFGIFTGGFEMPPSVATPFFLPGTTCTTVSGVVSFLDEDYSDEEDYSPLLASMVETVTP